MLFLPLALVKFLFLLNHITCLYTYTTVEAHMTTNFIAFLNALINESASKLRAPVLSFWGQGQKYDEPWINQSRSGLDKPLHSVMITAFSEQRNLCRLLRKTDINLSAMQFATALPSWHNFSGIWTVLAAICYNLLPTVLHSKSYFQILLKQGHFIYSNRALMVK